MNTKLILGVGLGLAALAAGGYYYANESALSTAKKEIAVLEPKIKETFRLFGPDWAKGETKFTYELKDVDLLKKTITLNNIVLSNSTERQSEKRSISISNLSISQDDDLISIERAENVHASIGKRGHVKLKKLNIRNFAISKIMQDFKNIDAIGLFENLKFNNFQIEGIEIKEKEKRPAQTLKLLSIDKFENGIVETLQLKNLHVQENASKPKITVKSITVDRFNVSRDLIAGSDEEKMRALLDVFGLSTLEIQGISFKENQDAPTQTLELVSIGKFENGIIENLQLKNLYIPQEKASEPVIGVKSILADRFNVSRDLIAGNDEEKMRAVLDVFGLSALEIQGISFKENQDAKEQKLGSFKLSASRADNFINDIELKISGAEISKIALIESRILPEEIANEFKENIFKFKTSLSAKWKPAEGHFHSYISAGLNKLGNLSLETRIAGISRDHMKSLQKNADFEKLSHNIAFNKIGLSYSDDGLKDLGLRLAKKNGMTREQIVQMASSSINQDKNFNATEKAKFSSAIQNFINSGKKIEISISSRNQSGTKLEELVISFMSSSLDKILEVDIKSE